MLYALQYSAAQQDTRCQAVCCCDPPILVQMHLLLTKPAAPLLSIAAHCFKALKCQSQVRIAATMICTPAGGEPQDRQSRQLQQLCRSLGLCKLLGLWLLLTAELSCNAACWLLC